MLAMLGTGALGGARGAPTLVEQLAWGPTDRGLPRQPAGSVSSRPTHLPGSWRGNRTPAIFREKHV